MKKLLIPIVAAFFLYSCDIASFDDNLNQNPNFPSEFSAPQLMANAMLSLPELSSSPQGEYMAQYLSKTDYVDNSLYPAGGTSFYWLYEEPLINLQKVIDNSEKANEVAVSKILKAYYFWHITDRWGPVPFSEALQGTEDFTPAYDKQAAIYESLFAMLEEANQMIEAGEGLENDIMYDGDMQKWVRFSNTLRLLMALRLSEVDAAKAEAEFNQALDAGIMESNEDNFVFQHFANANNQNFWYGRIIEDGVRWWAVSEGMMQLMKPVNDPRLSVYADTTVADSVDVNPDPDAAQYEPIDTYVGLPFGTTGDIVLNQYSLLGKDIHAQDAPVYLVTYAQVLFARAEAAVRGWTTENAETLYNEAVTASIEQWTGDTAGTTAFLGQAGVEYNPASQAEAVEQIATQRYVHLFMNGYEAWAEYRRTGYPDIMANPLGREVPLRQSYPADEELNNTENYNEAVGWLENGNTLYSPLWWDK
ncbi:MAG TPA: SusD/RagB family nutrient-binding outer membrane lipoprotein [Balneolaceae bacterium]